MKIRIGNLWNHENEYDIIYIPTNSSLNRKGELIMGAGAAKYVQENYPEYPKHFGDKVKVMAVDGIYGIIICTMPDIEETTIAAFQTKIDWSEPSPLELVTYSCGMFLGMVMVAQAITQKSLRIAIAFPGIGHGGLDPRRIYPYLKTFPDNVDVWAYPGELQKYGFNPDTQEFDGRTLF